MNWHEEGMDPNQLQTNIQQFLSRGNTQGGQGDYQDFLNQYMNAVNQRATPSQLSLMAATVPRERREAMLDYGGLNLYRDKNPVIRGAREQVYGLLDGSERYNRPDTESGISRLANTLMNLFSE